MSQQSSTIRYSDGAQEWQTQEHQRRNNSQLYTCKKKKKKKHKMHYTVALLFCLLPVFSMGTAAPLSVEVVKMKSRVKWMAEQLVVKLNRDFQAPDGLTINQTADDLNGSFAIATILKGYNSLISETFVGVSQIKSEILSLAGYLDNWRQGHCSESTPRASLPKPLEELQNRNEFVVTVSMEALMRVKEFLSVLLKNLDRLETC